MYHDDDATIGRIVLGRRAALRWFGGSAVGAAGLAALLPTGRGRSAGRAMAATIPGCVVRPEMTEGPYFVDELLERSDIRTDPSTGVARPGAKLTLAFSVSRIDGSSCSAWGDVQVDVWHCDAGGLYSDESANGTVGQKFLRGYQQTDADGIATFTTIYPGWYQGRTVHIHFKLRTASGLEFTSQLFFDDTLTDTVFASAPYASRGTRSTRNANDGIYQNGGSSLLLDVSSDGAGGYIATFDIGVQGVGATTTTVPGATTTTTALPAGGACSTVADCLDDLATALPAAATATDRASRRVAQKLARRLARISRALDRAAVTTGTRQARQYLKARNGLAILLSIAQAAATAGTLGGTLATIEAAVTALLAVIPS